MKKEYDDGHQFGVSAFILETGTCEITIRHRHSSLGRLITIVIPERITSGRPAFSTRYRLPNPKSSNPLSTYVDLCEPWEDNDPYDKFVAQHRLNLRKGVNVQLKAKRITQATARRLKKICDKVELLFLYPIVYRIDLSKIPGGRVLMGAGSGASGSSEVLIADLGETEFDLLFFDFDGDLDFQALSTGGLGDSKFALPILEGPC